MIHRLIGPRSPFARLALSVLAALVLAAPPAAPGAEAASKLKAAPAETAKKSDKTEINKPASSDQAPAERITTTAIKEPADFNECVRVALVQSPLLVKSALEIETKRLDAQDAWSTFIPTVSINTVYWFRMPVKTDGSSDKPYTISFSTGQWNPILSSFEVKARNEMTNIAILAHLKVIGGGLKRLGTDFLQLATIDQQRELTAKKAEMAKLSLEFHKTRLGMGQSSQLDVRIAETRLQVTKAEEEKLTVMRAMIMDDIKFILGVPFTHQLKLDVAKAKQQVLGTFNAVDLNQEKIRANSFDLRMMEYEKRLQQKNIGLSYVKLLPTFGFTFQTVDTFNNSSGYRETGFPFYPGINISLPLDYWTKGREIARQYKKLDQVNATSRAREFELMVSVQKAVSDLQACNSDLNMANSELELSKLKSEQTQYRYKTGQAEFDQLVIDNTDYYTKQQSQLLQQAKRDTALLELKHLNGDLQSQYIDVEAWEK